MTHILAALILLTLPLFLELFKTPRQRLWGFMALGALPFLPNLPLTGFLYGWPGWNGTVRGIGVSLMDPIAVALIMTRRRAPGRLPFWGFFLFYGLTILVSAVFAPQWYATMFVVWQFLRMALLFAAIGGEGHRPEVRAALLKGFAVGLIYQAAYVIMQKAGHVVQAYGTMGHQNILGLTIELAVIPLVAAMLVGYRSKLMACGVVAALICAAGTGSRGTLGLFIGGIAVLTLASLAFRNTPRKMRIVTAGIVVLVAATPFALATLNNRFHGGSYVTAELERSAFERAAIAMSNDHPLGVGANQFVFVSNRDGYAAREKVPWQTADRSIPVHNAYLLARAETGWIGELAFILFLGAPVVAGLHFAFRNRKSLAGDVALGSAIALATNMTHNNFEFATHTFVVQTLLIIDMGVIAALIRERRGAARRARGADRLEGPARALAPAGLVREGELAALRPR